MNNRKSESNTIRTFPLKKKNNLIHATTSMKTSAL